MLNHIHILGSSGSGTTTLASALATKHDNIHLDTDNFFWIATDPQFREKHPIVRRLDLLREAMPTEVRMQRLRAHELRRMD